MLDMIEFTMVSDTGGLFTNWYNTFDINNDSRLADREYTDGVFGLRDDDNDGLLTETEYTTFLGTYYGI